MPAAAANLLLNLAAPTNQATSQLNRASGDAEAQFSATLTLQMQTRQADEAAATQSTAALPSVQAQPNPVTAPTAAPPAPTNTATQPKPVPVNSNSSSTASTGSDEANSSSQSKAGDESTGTSSSATTSSQASSTSGSNTNTSSSTTSASDHTSHGPAKSGDKTQDAISSATAANDASLAQLQAYFAQGGQLASGGDTNGNGQTDKDLSDLGDAGKTIGVGTDAKGAERLGGSEKQGVERSLDSRIESTKIESAKLDVARQSLPTTSLAARGGDGFGQLLSTRMQTIASTAAGQQMAAATDMQGKTVGAAKDADDGESLRLGTTIYEPVGSDGWDKALGNKMVMMVSNQQQEVEMQLNPPHLGPLSVKLTMEDNQANVTFVAAHEPVRNAIEASMPRLNQMLAESGIQLNQSNVHSQAQGGDSRQSSYGNRQQTGASGRSIDGIGGIAKTTPVRPQLLSGLPGNVNLFV